MNDAVAGTSRPGDRQRRAARAAHRRAARSGRWLQLGPDRLPALAQVQTAEEAGFPGLQAEAWWAVFAPAGTPAPIVGRMNAALRETLSEERVRRQMEGTQQARLVLSDPPDAESLPRPAGRDLGPRGPRERHPRRLTGPEPSGADGHDSECEPNRTGRQSTGGATHEVETSLGAQRRPSNGSGNNMNDVARYLNTVDGRRREAAGGQWIASQNPFTGETWAEVPRCTPEDVGRGRDGRAPRVPHRRLAGADRNGARQAAAPARRPDLARRREARRHRGARQRQAAGRDGRAAPIHAGVVPLLRRPRRQDRGRRPADRQAGDVRLHQARAARRGGGDHPLELAAAAAGLEAGPGARRRLHGRHQAVGVHLLLHARLRRS